MRKILKVPPSSGIHQADQSTPEKHVHEKYTPVNVYRGIPIFLIFDPKHRLWILVRTASARRGGSHVYPRSLFLAKILKILKIPHRNFQFLLLKKKFCMLHGQVFVMICFCMCPVRYFSVKVYFGLNCPVFVLNNSAEMFPHYDI